MRSRFLPAARILLLGFTLGALLGRRWKGDLPDTLLGAVAFATIVVWAAALARFVREHERIAIGHFILEHHPARWTLRLERLGSLEFIELKFGPVEKSAEAAVPSEPRVSMLAEAKRIAAAQPWRVAALIISCVLTLWVLMVLPGMPPTADYTGPIGAWILAIAALIVSLAPQHLERPPRTWWQTHWRVALALAAITFAALILRVWSLGSLPFVLSGDEATFGIQAINMIQGAVRDPFVTGPLGQPNLTFFIGGLGARLLGPTMQGIRLPWAIIGVMAVPVAAWLVTRLTNVTLGLATAALLAVYHFDIHFSRLSINNIGDPLLAGLALLSMYRAIERRRPFDWALVGLVCGASLYVYQGARFVPLLILAVAIYLSVFERGFWSKHAWGLGFALVAFLIVGAPMLQFAYRFPDDYNSRINEIGIFQSGWINLATAQGQSVPSVLWDQFVRSVLAFNYFSDRTIWYGLPGPLLDPIFGALFLIGLGYATASVLVPGGNHKLFPMVAWWWGVTILGGMLTQNPPSSMRLVSLTVPVSFFIVLTLWKAAGLVRSRISLPPRVFLAAGWLLFAVISLKTYFVDYGSLNVYGGPAGEAATMIGQELRAKPPSGPVYFFGAPTAYWTFPTFQFFLPNVNGTDVSEPLAAAPPKEWMQGADGALFIFLPARIGELDLVQAAFPGGQVTELVARDRLVATLYQVGPLPPAQ